MDGTLDKTSGVDAAEKRLRPVFTSAAVLLTLLLVFFALALLRSQSQQRDDIEQRFNDRADVAGAVNEAIFELSQQSIMAQDAAQFGGPKVDAALLDQRVAQNQGVYAQIIDARGKVLGQTKGAPDRDPLSLPHVQKALKSGRTEYSSVIEGPGGRPIFESATPFKSVAGPRVDISAARAELLSQFLNGFLEKLPTVSNARSYVVDSAGLLVSAPGTKIKPGASVPDRELSTALKGGNEGEYGDDRFFTSADIEGSPWRIVLSASQEDLYEPIDTVLPWIIFGSFVLASAFGLWLLRRVLAASTELARAELSRRHALEINDNVVQRLVIAKYALDRGATATSQQKLAETLRETQQLVTSLLEQKSIEPGSLRREQPAETDAPPPPPEAMRK